MCLFIWWAVGIGKVYYAKCGLQKFEKVYFAEFRLRNVPQITP